MPPTVAGIAVSKIGSGALSDEPDLTAALSGDQEAFRRLADKHRAELHLHCYRMLGSFHDAEDGVQETMLRAWRHLPTFEGRSSFRAWLYRIATNVCLTRGRIRPAQGTVPKALAEEAAWGSEPVIALSPYPDELLDQVEGTWADPAALFDLHESVQLAFLAAVQLLPPRQRAALLLHDVLGWSLAEVAGMLDSTVASVNGAITRARASLAQQRAAGRLQTGRITPTNEIQQALVERYIEAWQTGDVGKLAGILKDDVVLTMPPRPLRYAGRSDVAEFYGRVPFATHLRWRLISTRANRQPAVAVYRLDPARGTYQGQGIWVLTTDGDSIGEITAFVDAKLLPAFGLPAETPAK